MTGARRHSKDIPQGGLEVPCTLTLKGSGNDIEKVKKLVKRALLSTPTERIDKENEPPRKKIRLDLPDTEVNKINGGEKLTDLSMNLAQQLINNQFPAINGLQSTLLQNKPRIGAAPMDQLQIIHSRGDHWIVASTVGSNGDEVQVCDSVYNTLDQTTLGVIANLFHSSTVKMVMCQRRRRLWIICYRVCHCNCTRIRPTEGENQPISHAESPCKMF